MFQHNKLLINNSQLTLQPAEFVRVFHGTAGLVFLCPHEIYVALPEIKIITTVLKLFKNNIVLEFSLSKQLIGYQLITC